MFNPYKVRFSDMKLDLSHARLDCTSRRGSLFIHCHLGILIVLATIKYDPQHSLSFIDSQHQF